MSKDPLIIKLSREQLEQIKKNGWPPIIRYQGEEEGGRMENSGQKRKELVANLKAALPRLEKLLEDTSDEWGYEDKIY